MAAANISLEAAASLSNITCKQQISNDPSNFTLKQILGIPSEEEIASRESLFTELASGLLGKQASRCQIGKGPDAYISPAGGGTLALVQTGLHGMGLWKFSDTMECLCVGTMSDDEFLNRVSKDPGAASLSPQVIRNSEESEDEVRLMILLRGVLINIRYCQTPAVENWDTLHSIPAWKLRAPPPVVRALNGYRDIQYMSTSIPALGNFRMAYRLIVRWARSHGLFSHPLGYLDDTQILYMLNRIAKLDSPETPSSYDLARTFFSYYSDFNWEGEAIADPLTYELNPEGLPFNRGYLAPAVILTINTPLTNVASSVSDRSLETLVKGFERAKQRIADSNTNWYGLLSRGNDFPLAAREFIDSFNGFVRFEMQYWGTSKKSQAAFYAKMEEEFLSLCNCIKSRRAALQTRPWPSPFTENSAPDSEKKSFYLIGLDDAGLPKNQQGNSPLEVVCNNFFKQFTERGASDPTISWVDISVVGKPALGDIICDTRDWGSGQGQDNSLTAAENAKTPKVSPAKAVASSEKAVAGKLRPASDILSRLVWDPNIDRTDYIIGYEDRFLGSKELPLELWKTNTTDEEFIPQHRILYFKRRGDGEIVWDRVKRIDKIFGSGKG